MNIKITAYLPRSGHTVKMCRYIKIFFYIQKDLCSSDIKESVTARSINRKMAVNMANSSLPNEEANSSLVHRFHRAMTREVPRERSRVSGYDSSNVKDELSRNFQILHVVAQKSPLCNPRVRETGKTRDGGTSVTVKWVKPMTVQSVTHT